MSHINLDTAFNESYKGPLSKQTFKKVAFYFVEEILSYMFDGHEVLLPKNFGSVFVKGRKYKVRKFDNGNYNIPIDWEATYELWESCPECAERGDKMYQTNDHSDGVVYKIIFSNSQCKYRFRKVYKFVAFRAVKRKLASLIKEGKKYYISR